MQGFDLIESNPCLFYIALRTILRITYHLLYHSFAWSYDLVAATVSIGKWNDWVREVLPWMAGKKVLEVGFGPGHLQVELTRRGFQVYGLDESEQMVRQAARRIKKQGQKANLTRGLSQGMPFPEHFDTIVATFPSEYIFDPNTIKEFHRVLLPGGVLIILLSAMPPHGSVFAKILRRASDLFFREQPNPLENRLEKIIQDYRKEGLILKKVYLERKAYSLILFVGEKLIDYR